MARKKENKSAKIRELLDKGVLQKDIVKKLKVSQQLVYIVARNHGVMSGKQSSLTKKAAVTVNKTAVKRGRPSGKNERVVLAKLWSILNDYRNAA